MIEDVDRAGYDEAGLFHLLNQSMRDQRPLLMTAREDIANWPFATDDLTLAGAARGRVRHGDDATTSNCHRCS